MPTTRSQIHDRPTRSHSALRNVTTRHGIVACERLGHLQTDRTRQQMVWSESTALPSESKPRRLKHEAAGFEPGPVGDRHQAGGRPVIIRAINEAHATGLPVIRRAAHKKAPAPKGKYQGRAASGRALKQVDRPLFHGIVKVP